MRVGVWQEFASIATSAPGVHTFEPVVRIATSLALLLLFDCGLYF